MTLSCCTGAGARVAVRPLTLDYLRDLHVIAGSEDPATGWPFVGQELPLAAFRDYLRGQCSIHYVLVRRDIDKAIGLVQGMDEDPRNETIGVGVFVEPLLWGTAWPFEGVVLFVDHLFACLGYRKLYFTMPEPVVARLSSRIDRWLTREATQREHVELGGTLHDVAIYALHRRDWSATGSRWWDRGPRPVP